MSLLFAPAEQSQRLRARLHLFAVIPAIPELLRLSPKARELLGNRRFSVRIACRELKIDLALAGGRARSLRNPALRPPIRLRFLTYRQLNRSFADQGGVPVPIFDPRHVRDLCAFSGISGLLREILHPGTPAGEAGSSVETRLRLRIALMAVAELIRHEPFSSGLFSGNEDWCVRIGIDGTDFRFEIGARNGSIYSVPRWECPAQAELRFAGPEIAGHALRPDFDSLAAVNETQIRISGRLPLVEQLSVVLDRVHAYLDSPAHDDVSR